MSSGDDILTKEPGGAEPGEIATAFAHEINQALTAILANAQAARRFVATGSADTPEILAILDDIILADKHAAGLVRDLRDMSGETPTRIPSS
jgi:C4-dicarboxylate-specific signal transduction histidine kinase